MATSTRRISSPAAWHSARHWHAHWSTIPACCCWTSRSASLISMTRITMQGERVALWQRSGFTALPVTHDVEEALFLAQRVIVLSDRPASIKTDVPVDLPYPRHRGDPRLAELRRAVLGMLGLDATW